MPSGKADESLLETYQAERMPHAQDLVEWTAAIIRPDRYVFGHVTESQDLNFLLRELGAKFSIF